MDTDKIRLVATYFIAVLVIVVSYGILLLDTPNLAPEAKLALVVGNTGIVLTFIFNKESSASGARASERAFTQGANAATGNTPPAPPAP